MTVSSNIRTAGPFIGTGVLTTYPFAFKVFSTTDVQGVFTDTNGNDTQLVNGTDFTVVLNTDQNGSPGGVITYVPNTGILPTGDKLTFTSNLNNFQTLQLTNQGGFLPTVINDAFDRCVILIQQALRKANASLQFPLSDGTSVITTLPTALQRANKGLAFDASGNPIAGSLSSVPVSAAMTPVFQAVTLALGRTAFGLGTLATLNIGARLINDGSGNLTTANAPANTLAGNLTGASAAPTDNTLASVGAALNTLDAPQGRLTLTGNTPVMVADATAQTSIFYTPYGGNVIPVYNGSAFVNTAFSQLTLTLNTTNHLSTRLYDVFAFMNAGVLTIAAGPAWTSNTARSAAITPVNGIWVNNAVISLTNGATTYASIAANQATYLGSFYATANGQTGMQFTPAAASGGANTILGVWNAYNRVRFSSQSLDSTASWTYASTTLRAANGSNSNRISYVDGLGQSTCTGEYVCYASSGAGQTTILALGFNSATTSAGVSGTVGVATSGSSTALGGGRALGLNFIQALEANGNGTNTTNFAGSGVNQMLRATMEM